MSWVLVAGFSIYFQLDVDVFMQKQYFTLELDYG